MVLCELNSVKIKSSGLYGNIVTAAKMMRNTRNFVPKFVTYELCETILLQGIMFSLGEFDSVCVK